MPACLIPFEQLVRDRAEEDRRLEALRRLYERRDKVDDLIRSLENYQRFELVREASAG
jgi:hypothetical protein